MDTGRMRDTPRASAHSPTHGLTYFLCISLVMKKKKSNEEEVLQSINVLFAQILKANLKSIDLVYKKKKDELKF